MIAPESKRRAVELVIEVLGVSERRACTVIGQPRSTQRYDQVEAEDTELLRQRIIELASEYGRYGYRRITAMLRNEGWLVNHKRVQRIWRQEGLKVPQKQPKRGRLWLKGGGVINEGTIFPVRRKNPKQGYAYHVPYRSILPKPEQCNNLLVPVALSLSVLSFR